MRTEQLTDFLLTSSEATDPEPFAQQVPQLPVSLWLLDLRHNDITFVDRIPLLD